MIFSLLGNRVIYQARHSETRRALSAQSIFTNMALNARPAPRPLAIPIQVYLGPMGEEQDVMLHADDPLVINTARLGWVSKPPVAGRARVGLPQHKMAKLFGPQVSPAPAPGDTQEMRRRSLGDVRFTGAAWGRILIRLLVASR